MAKTKQLYMPLIQSCMKFGLFISLCLCSFFVQSQTNNYFIESQKNVAHAASAFKVFQDSLERQFKKQNLKWPPEQVYLRSYKYDGKLEVWIKSNKDKKFSYFKSYKICALSGAFGPKRMEGDFQVPEGFYYINYFKPNSTYHMALGLNYPNLSDEILSDSIKPGGDIYIHGSCATVGCIPIEDLPIEELYVLACYARQNGHEFIPVHIFPINFSSVKSVEYLNKTIAPYPAYKQFVNSLKLVFDYFEVNKQLPFITIDKQGKYYINN